MRVNQEARTASAEKRREKTRQALIEAAIRVIARSGPSGGTIEDITAEAGVAKGTFYNHFDSLDAMVGAIGDRIAERMKHVMLHAQTVFGDEPARMIAYGCRIFLDGVTLDPIAGWLVVHIGTAGTPFATHHRTNFLTNVELGVQRGIFTPLEQPQAAVDMLLGTLIYAARSILEGRTQPEHSRVITELILRALGLDPPEAKRLGWLDWTELAPPELRQGPLPSQRL